MALTHLQVAAGLGLLMVWSGLDAEAQMTPIRVSQSALVEASAWNSVDPDADEYLMVSTNAWVAFSGSLTADVELPGHARSGCSAEQRTSVGLSGGGNAVAASGSARTTGWVTTDPFTGSDSYGAAYAVGSVEVEFSAASPFGFSLYANCVSSNGQSYVRFSGGSPATNIFNSSQQNVKGSAGGLLQPGNYRLDVRAVVDKRLQQHVNPAQTIAMLADFGFYFYAGPQPPRLQWRVQDDTLVLSWPTNATGLSLWSSADLGAWTPATNSVHVVGDQNFVTNSMPASAGFFRLGL